MFPALNLSVRRPGSWVRPARLFAIVALVLLVSSALVSPSALAAGDKTKDERLKALEAEVAALKAALETLRGDLAQAPPAASGEASQAAPQDRLAEVERRIEVLAAELERLQLGEAVVEAKSSEHGMGPAASKIYQKDHGLSIGGYGEMLYQGFDSELDNGAPSGATDELDFLRAIVYFGYKFNDRVLFNSEIEYEHAQAGEDADGEVSVEFAYLDFLMKPEVNLRAGLVLIPMGFVNELHEPTVFLGARRPDVERNIIPTTWRENGFGLFGEVGPFTYRTYVVNGFDASGFSASGLRGGRQSGSKASAEDFAWVGRLDYTGTPGLLVGGSAYVGNGGQGLETPDGREVDAGVSLYEGHLEWRHRGFQLRALGAKGEVDDAADLNLALGLTGNRSVGEEMEGYYVELAYDVLSQRGGVRSLLPYVRWESFDTQSKVPAGFARNPARDVDIFTLGVAFKPIDQVILKFDYQDFDNEAGTGRDQFNVALGYIF